MRLPLIIGCAKYPLITLAVLAVSLMAPQPTHAQTETVLYRFRSQSGDGWFPNGPLIMDQSGNLYGTSSEGGLTGCSDGGVQGCGTVFRVTPTGSETVLYNFCPAPNCTDGANPAAGLIMDKSGNLYGTTMLGGWVLPIPMLFHWRWDSVQDQSHGAGNSPL